MANLNQLSQRILGLSKKLHVNANLMTQDAARAFANEVIDRAPVDTGLLVSSWKVGLNYQPRGTRIFSPGELGSTAAANKAAVREVLLARIAQRVTGQTISFTNSTPYLEYVNKGEYEQVIKAALMRAKDAVKQRKLL